MSIDFADCYGNAGHCKAMPDTGTSTSMVHRRILDYANVSFDPNKTRPISAANATPLQCDGTARLLISFEGQRIETDVLVSSDLQEDFLVSYGDLLRLGVIPESFPESTCYSDYVNAVQEQNGLKEELDLPALVSEYGDVFNESSVTPMNCTPMKIHLRRSDPDYRPVRVTTARKVPLHFQAEAEKTLQWFIDSGVIERVPTTEQVEWCSPGFFVPKPGGKVRLVVDYRGINKHIERPVHPFPSPRDILKGIKPDSKWFLKLDAVQGYYQVPLDEESAALTTFLLPSGRYRFCRAPMGLSPSSDGFCERTDIILAPVPDMLKIVDDALLQAPTKEQLLKKLETALACCRKHNLTLSASKMSMGQSIKFAGYLISADGVKPDPGQVQALRNFPVPSSLTELRSFLGLANQLAFLLPDLAHVTAGLRPLLKKDVAFLWLPEHQKSFEDTVKLLTSDMIVKPFDPSFKTELLTDASRLKGLGYALIQRAPDSEQPRLIQCGSRALNSAERRYAPNELECLAITYAVLDCRFYLQGGHFDVITDHKPLVGSFNKPLSDIPNARIQRLREKLSDFSFEVHWVPGKVHLIADALSRAPFFDPPEQETVKVNLVLVNSISDPAIQPLDEAAKDDPDYVAVREAIAGGKTIANLPPSHPAKLFSRCWDDLSILHNLIVLDDSRIVVPRSKRRSILDLLHRSHAGVTRTYKTARAFYYWPSMKRDIETLLLSCEECQMVRPSQHDVVKPFPEATEPMHSVSLDLFSHAGQDHLVMVDRFSNFLWVQKLKSTSTAAVINTLRGWFQDFGLPFEVISDNGPQFRSDFSDFCRTLNIHHRTSSPYNPASNGLAESAVKSAKHLLQKSSDWSDFLSRLTAWRATASTDGLSPAEKFWRRVPRTELPRLSSLEPLQASTVPSTLPELPIGTVVLCQDPHSLKWDDFAEIVELCNSGHSYKLKRSDGSTITRGRKFIKPREGGVPQSAEQTIPSPPSLRRSSRVSRPPVHFKP